MRTLRCVDCLALVQVASKGGTPPCSKCGGQLVRVRPGKPFVTGDGWSARYAVDADGRLRLEYEYEDGDWHEADAEQSILFDNHPEYE